MRTSYEMRKVLTTMSQETAFPLQALSLSMRKRNRSMANLPPTRRSPGWSQGSVRICVFAFARPLLLDEPVVGHGIRRWDVDLLGPGIDLLGPLLLRVDDLREFRIVFGFVREDSVPRLELRLQH